jgi:hypothetical protein
MDFLRAAAVNLGLGRRQPREGVLGTGPHGRRQRQPADDVRQVPNVPQGLCPGGADVHALARDALVAAVGNRDRYLDAGQQERLAQGVEIHSQPGHGGQEHVAGNAGWTIKMHLGHDFPRGSRCRATGGMS